MTYLSKKELITVLSLVLLPGFPLFLGWIPRVSDSVEVVVDSFKLKNQAGHFTSAQSMEVDDGGFLYRVVHVDELLVTIDNRWSCRLMRCLLAEFSLQSRRIIFPRS